MMVYFVLTVAIIYPFADEMMMLFVNGGEQEVIANAAQLMRISNWFYPALGVLVILRYSIQGLGYSNLSMMSGMTLRPLYTLNQQHNYKEPGINTDGADRRVPCVMGCNATRDRLQQGVPRPYHSCVPKHEIPVTDFNTERFTGQQSSSISFTPHSIPFLHQLSLSSYPVTLTTGRHRSAQKKDRAEAALAASCPVRQVH